MDLQDLPTELGPFESADFYPALLESAAKYPYMKFADVIAMALRKIGSIDDSDIKGFALTNPDLDNPETLALWCWANAPKAVSAFRLGKGIHAIKEIRGATYAGLKQAKDAYDWLRKHEPYASLYACDVPDGQHGSIFQPNGSPF